MIGRKRTPSPAEERAASRSAAETAVPMSPASEGGAMIFTSLATGTVIPHVVAPPLQQPPRSEVSESDAEKATADYRKRKNRNQKDYRQRMKDTIEQYQRSHREMENYVNAARAWLAEAALKLEELEAHNASLEWGNKELERRNKELEARIANL